MAFCTQYRDQFFPNQSAAANHDNLHGNSSSLYSTMVTRGFRTPGKVITSNYSTAMVEPSQVCRHCTQGSKANSALRNSHIETCRGTIAKKFASLPHAFSCVAAVGFPLAETPSAEIRGHFAFSKFF